MTSCRAGADSNVIDGHVARIVASSTFAQARDQLIANYYDQEIKDRIIREVRNEIASPSMDVPVENVDDVRRAVILRLVGLASRAAQRPRTDQERPRVSRAPQDLQRMILNEFPRPIALCYRELAEAEPGVAAFGPLLDTFESLISFIATVLLSAYWRDGAPNNALNARLSRLFRGRAWSIGNIIELVRETARVYLRSADTLPYPQLVSYLFKRDGSKSTSLAVLESFVNIRNEDWAHTTGRTAEFFSEIFPVHRKRLDEELDRCEWLTMCSLWLPKKIDDSGHISLIDVLDGNTRLRDKGCSFDIDQKDLFRNDPKDNGRRIGDIIPEKTLILVNKENSNYLPLFPVSSFLLRIQSQGTFFLNHLEWDDEGVRRAHYVTYDLSRSVDFKERKYAARRHDLEVMLLQAHVQKLENSLPVETIAELSSTTPRRADYNIAGVWAEQQFHLQTFAGRETWLAKLSAWASQPGQGEYLLVLGSPGQGKSALLSEFAHREHQAGRSCLLHLVKSQNEPGRFLRFLLWQAADALGEDIDPAVYAGDVAELRNALQAAFDRLARSRGRALLVIDGLDELAPANDRLAFLPEYLAKGVKVVLSCRLDIPMIGEVRRRCRPLEEWILPGLTPQELSLFLEKHLEKYPEIDAAQKQKLAHDIDFGSLLRRMDGNAMLLRYALERIAADTRAGRPVEVAALPDSAEPFCIDVYNDISEKTPNLQQPERGRQKARIFEFLTLAAEPLTIEEVRGLLQAEGQSLSLEDVRDLMMEMSQYLLSAEERFKPCYEIVAEFITSKILGESGRAATHKVFCRWLAQPNSQRLHYFLQHYAQHLIKAGDTVGLVDLGRSDWIERHAKEFGLPAALEQTKSVVNTLAEAGPVQREALFAAAERYSDLLDAFRGDPERLIDLIEKDEPARVISAIKAQRDPTLRASLLIGIAPIISGLRDRIVALMDGWQEFKRVRLQAESSARPRETIRALLICAIIDRRSEWLSADPPGRDNTKCSEEKFVDVLKGVTIGTARKRIPFYCQLLVALATPRPTYYLVVLLNVALMFVGLSSVAQLLFQTSVLPRNVGLLASVVLAAALLFWLPLQWSIQKLLRRVKVGQLIFEVTRYCEHEKDVEKRKRRLDHLLRFAVSLVRVPLDRSSWESLLPYLAVERFRLTKGDALSGATLLLASGCFGANVTMALSNELQGLDSEAISEIFREVRSAAYPGAGHLGTLKMMASVLDRTTERESFFSYLTFAITTMASQGRLDEPERQIDTILNMVASAELGKLLLSTLAPERPRSHVSFDNVYSRVYPWLPVPFDKLFGYPRPVSKFDCWIFVLSMIPAVAITTPTLLLYLAPWTIAGFFAGRLHDPYGLNRALSASTVARSRSILSTLFIEGIREPDFSLKVAWARIMRGRIPLNWIVAPSSLRVIRETLYLQGILRQTVNEDLQTTLSSQSRRRIEYTLLKRNMIGRELLPSVIGDRQLLNAVKNLSPSVIYQAGKSPDPARDDVELRRALPLTPALLNFVLVSALSTTLVLAWWLAVMWIAPAPQSFWLFSFRYGGSALLGICLMLAASQHGYGILAASHFGRSIAPRRSIVSRAFAYQLTVGTAFLAVFLLTNWSVLPVMRCMAANAGLSVPQSTTSDYLYPVLISVLIVNLFVPSFIARWRGFGLLYPTKRQLWRQRLVSAGVLIVVLSLLVVFADLVLRQAWSGMANISVVNPCAPITQ